jgi:NAD(P)-dependent dehydrogenase (short-subunit alcohol dehydrogenase family)
MDLQLKGKRAVVTGSTAGIGLAIADTLAFEGASVVVNGVRGNEPSLPQTRFGGTLLMPM